MKHLLILFFLSTLTFATARLVLYQGGEHATDHVRHTQKRVLKGGGGTVGNPKAKPTGRDLGQLTVDHWKWNLCGGDGNGGSVFAFFDPECPQQVDVPNKWVFLAGGLDDSSERSCDVSKKDFILIPVINYIYLADTDQGETLDDAKAYCNEKTAESVATKATIDGKDAKVVRLQGAVESFDITCPDDIVAIFDVNVNGWPMASDGLWVVIEPLSKGHHLIELAGENSNAGIELDFKYTLTAK
jgi:hypothetical protein